MKILMVSNIVTHPQNAGNRQRIYRECESLKKLGHEVDFLLIGDMPRDSVNAMQEYFGRKHFHWIIKDNDTIYFKIKGLLRNWANRKGISRYKAVKFNVDEWYVDKIGQKVKELHERNGYDVVWTTYIMFSKALEALSDSNVLKVLDTQDRFSNRDKIFRKKKLVPGFFYTTKTGERKALNRSDVIVAIQEKEAEFFSKLVKGQRKVVTLGDMLDAYECKDGEPNSYGFIGSNNEPNVEGLRYFCESVLPMVQKRCPDSKFYVAGDVCSVIPDYSGCIKLGRVKELTDFYDLIKVAVVPVRMGTGLNIKSIEAIAYGKPLITTEVGSKGIECEEEIYVCASTDEAFADCIIELLQNPERCEKLKQNSRKYIRNYNEKNEQQIESIVYWNQNDKGDTL